MTDEGAAAAMGSYATSDDHADEMAAGVPVIPISWGELYDKIAILEIKQQRLTSQRQLANVTKELELLRGHVRREEHEDLADLVADIREVNAQIWTLDDDIREKEREKEFNEDFIAVARALYQQNDRRAALKLRINRLLGSALSEEKSYKAY